MTRHGKCETCRKRKVKCDEKRPTCGACSIKRRPCYYNDSVFILEKSPSHDDVPAVQTAIAKPSRSDHNGETPTLRLKRHRKALAGDGEFLTFESVKPALLCKQTRITGSLGSIFGYAALDLAPLGPWVKLGWPSSIGTNACLELASEYALETAVAFQHQHSEQSLERASKTGLVAIRSLQSSIESCQRDEDKQALVVAVMLHFAAENFAGIATWRYIPHLKGVCHLLNSYFKNKPNNPVVQKVISLICDHEVAGALHFGTASQLESIARPQYSLALPPSVDVATTLVDDLMIRVPRLTRAVRACVQDQDSFEKMAEASELARQLYHSESVAWIQKTIVASSRTTTTTSDSDDTVSPSGVTRDFNSVPAYVLATRYFLSRTLVCGLLRTLTLLPKSRYFFPSSIESEVDEGEMSAATSVAECVDFAFRPNPAQSLISVAIIMPLEASLGTWSRRERRSSSAPESKEYQQAMEMKDFCIRHLRTLCTRWQAGPIPRNRMEELYDVFVGGPILKKIYDYEKNGEVNPGRVWLSG